MKKIISKKLELKIEQFVTNAPSPQNRTLPLLLRRQMLALMVDVEVELRDLVDLTAEVALKVIHLVVVDLVQDDLVVINVVQVDLVDLVSVRWLRC